MYEPILQRMRQCVQQGRYYLSIHALEEMDDESIGRYDIEYTIRTGKIIERQRDWGTGEYKYRILGSRYAGQRMEVVARLDTKECIVVITVYLL